MLFRSVAPDVSLRHPRLPWPQHRAGRSALFFPDAPTTRPLLPVAPATRLLLPVVSAPPRPGHPRSMFESLLPSIAGSCSGPCTPWSTCICSGLCTTVMLFLEVARRHWYLVIKSGVIDHANNTIIQTLIARSSQSFGAPAVQNSRSGSA